MSAGELVEGETNGLNPCYSGICSVSLSERLTLEKTIIGLNPCYSGICSVRCRQASK